MNKNRPQTGFTLVEIMVVITIISILASMTIPTYYQYVQSAHSKACLAEVKDYGNDVFIVLNDQDNSTFPRQPVISTCHSITNAIGWTLATQKKIVAIAKSPSNARIECDLPNGSPCRVLP